jgi:hypothetical protein
VTYSVETKALPFVVFGVAGDPAGTMIAFSQGAPGTYGYSTDGGDTWLTSASPIPTGFSCVSWNGDYFLAVYNNTVAKSATGLPGSWSTSAMPTNPSRNWDPALAWSESLGRWLMTLGAASSSNPTVATSPDGVTWTNNNIVGGTNKITLDCVWDDDNARFVVILQDVAAGGERKVYASASGTGGWSHIGTVDIAEADPDYLVVMDGTLVAYGNSPMAVSGDGGVTWTYPGYTRAFGVTVVDDQFVYSELNAGRYITSPDGLTWTETDIDGFAVSPPSGLESRSYKGDGATYAFLLNGDTGTDLHIFTAAPPPTPPFWEAFVDADEAVEDDNRLEKDSDFSSDPGAPGRPETPGTPARPGYWAYEDTVVCGLFSSGVEYQFTEPTGFDEEPQVIPVSTSPGGIGVTRYECRTLRKRVWHPPVAEVVADPGDAGTNPRTVYDYNLGWNAGARSIDFIVGDGYAQFSADESIVGAVAGLASFNSNSGYGDIEHAWMVVSGIARIYESGALVHSYGGYNDGDVFKILRLAGVVTYYVNDVLVYTSTQESEGALYLDASLYSGGDSIYSPVIAGLSSAYLTLPALAMRGGIPLGEAYLDLPALTLSAGEGEEGDGATLELPMLTMMASDHLTGQVALELPAFTMSADGGYALPEFALAALTLPALQCVATGLTGEIGGANLTLPALNMLAGDGVYGEAQVELPGLVVFADASEGPLNATLALVGDVAAPVSGTFLMAAVILESVEADPSFIGARVLVAQLDAGVEILDSHATALVLEALLPTAVDVSEPTTAQAAGFSDYEVWLVDVETGANVQWEQYEFDSFARIGQAYFGCRADGIYRLSGDDDAGEPIRASLNFGRSELGTSDVKRVPHVYVGAKSDGNIVLRVQVDEGTAYTYNVRAVDAAKKAQRFDLGGGLAGTYWQLELYNEAGADFDIDWVEVRAVPVRRKI